MRPSRILHLLGSSDPVIKEEEMGPDAEKALGRENVDISALEGGHELPVTKNEDVAQKIWHSWGQNQGSPKRD